MAARKTLKVPRNQKDRPTDGGKGGTVWNVQREGVEDSIRRAIAQGLQSLEERCS